MTAQKSKRAAVAFPRRSRSIPAVRASIDVVATAVVPLFGNCTIVARQ
jgi:hypothetical protein